MRFNGDWRTCDDGVVRPLIDARVMAQTGEWRTAHFLVDIGADRTVFSADLLYSLGLLQQQSSIAISGVGGGVDSVVVGTTIQLKRDDGVFAKFRGEFAAFTDTTALDMSVMGRDILNMFAVILDRQKDIVAILGAGHSYSITSNG